MNPKSLGSNPCVESQTNKISVACITLIDSLGKAPIFKYGVVEIPKSNIGRTDTISFPGGFGGKELHPWQQPSQQVTLPAPNLINLRGLI